MISLQRPRDLAPFLDAQRTLAFTYAEVGATRDALPRGYAHDVNRVQLGTGDATFQSATHQLADWRMVPPWVQVEPRVPIAGDQVLGVLVNALGVWFTNAARIVYVIDEPRRYGFAYGTLPGHAERGEERFLVEHLADDSVWYDVRAFSRPRYWPARLAYPLTRLLQKQFGRDSKRAMLRALR